MKLIHQTFVGIAAMAISNISFAWVSDTIIKTVNNSDGPGGNQIAIKNVDLHQVQSGELGNVSPNIFYLSVYLWVKPDLGEQTGDISLVDVDDLSLQPISATADPSQPSLKVGFDQATGYFVYLVKMLEDPETSVQNSAFYASVNENGTVYYSNQGNPTQYFIFSSGD